MTDRQSPDLQTLVEHLTSIGAPPEREQLEQVALCIAKHFKVEEDEVAVLALDTKSKSLKFVLPEKLSQIGTIPISSTVALAARTVREKRAELVNNFTASRHASVFEGVPLGRRQGDLIHKIMSAPILDENKKVAGVVQISRKGQSARDAGPDFTQKDLSKLSSLSPDLARFLRIVSGS